MRDALRVGIGVFNAGDHRLARDAWEAPRVEGDEGTCGGGPPDEQLLDGLAQYAVAVDHARRREWSGCVDLAERGVRSLREIDGDHRGVNVAEVCAFLRRLAADPEFAERRRPLALRHGGDAVTPIDLSFENVATAADLIAAEHDAFEAAVVADAVRYARAELADGREGSERGADADVADAPSGRTAPTRSRGFVGMLFDFAADRDRRGLIYSRLRAHVERRRSEERDVSGLFE